MKRMKKEKKAKTIMQCNTSNVSLGKIIVFFTLQIIPVKIERSKKIGNEGENLDSSKIVQNASVSLSLVLN